MVFTHGVRIQLPVQVSTVNVIDANVFKFCALVAGLMTQINLS